MLKCLLALASICCILTTAAAKESSLSNVSKNDFDIQFIDFPDNSIPDCILQDLLLSSSSSPSSSPSSPSTATVHRASVKPPKESEVKEMIEQQSEFGIETHSFPSAIVNGCVNAITGTYIESTNDYSFPGSVPLEMKRFYHSGTCKKESLLYGWQLNHGGKLYAWTKHNHLHALIKGGDRQGVHFKEHPFQNDALCCPDYFFDKWVTNCALGQMNAFTNFKNDVLIDRYSHIELFTADRLSSRFEKLGKKDGVQTYNLEDYQLLNGNSFTYEYATPFGMPSSIVLKDREGKGIAKIQLKNTPRKYQFLSNPELTYITPSGERLNYRFDLYKGENRAILSEVIPPHAPSIKYTYLPFREHEKKPKLYRRELPDYRALEIDYYDRDGRVRNLLSPSGENNKLVPTHTFSYYKDKYNACTVVKNAIGEVKKYLWDKETHRLDSITTYQEYQYNDNQKDCEDHVGQIPLFKETFQWGIDGSHLICHTLATAHDDLIALREYQYNQDGNISSTHLYGNLTGQHAAPASLSELDASLCDVFKVNYTYDEQKRRHTEDDGRTLTTYHYLGHTHLVSARFTSYEGRIQIRRFYRYDLSGAISQEIIDDGSAESINDLTNVTERLIKEIKNTPAGLPIVIEEYALDLKSGETQLLRKTLNEYTTQGWLTSQSTYDCNNQLAYTLHWKHDSHGNVISKLDALGHETYLSYDANDNLIYEAKPDFTPRTLTYDHMNRLTSETLRGETESFHKGYRYDAMGNRILSIDIYGRETHYKYDPHGRLEEVTYPALYESQKRLTYTYKRNEQGFATQITDPKGHTTTITYNIRGKPTFIAYPDGTSESHRYTLWGELAESTLSDGTQIAYTYDPLGREIKREWFDINGQRIKTTSKRYNAFHLISELDGNGNTTEYTYDSAGRLASKKIARRLITYAYDNLGRLSTTTHHLKNDQTVSHVNVFDYLDQVIKSYTICPNGEVIHKVTRQYDAQGNEIRRKERNQAGAAFTKTTYDLFGRQKSVTNPLGEITQTFYPDKGTLCKEVIDSRGTKTTIIYDAFDHPVLEQCHNAMGQLESEVKTRYDLNGNRASRRVTTENSPIRTKWRYNKANQLISTIEAVGTEDQKSVRREYNKAGRLERIIKNDGVILTYEYDTLGRKNALISSDGTVSYTYQYDQNDNLLRAKDKVNHATIVRTYNPHNELETETLPSGNTLAYKYDFLGNVKRVTLPDQTRIHYHYDGTRLQSIRRSGALSYSHTYEKYDHSSNPTHMRLPGNAGTLRIDYDLLHRTICIESPAWKETSLYKDQLLNKRTLHDDFGKASSAYTYDARKQLLTENGVADHQFEYDWQGNIKQHNGHARKHNARNALVSHRKRDYTYDLNGNRTSDGQSTYHYDALDRLIKVETPSGVYTYTYDALDRRLLSSHHKEKTYYLWQQHKEIGSLSKGEIKELQLLGSSNRPVAFELQGALYIPIIDAFGHIRSLVDSTGNCVATYRYSAFGKEEIQGKILSPWRYAGKRIDAETGLIYFGKRYYVPKTLCWLTPDRLEDIDGPNHYAYVRNNPLLYNDPNGYAAIAVPAVVIKISLDSIIAFFTAEAATTAAVGTVAVVTVGAVVVHNISTDDSQALENATQDKEDEKKETKQSDKSKKKPYAPDKPLPLSPHGVQIVETNAPHTQLGTRDGEKGKYPQAREFDENGKPVRDIDFTDHGRPQNHPNPHQHKWEKNSTGGSYKRVKKAEPVTGWNYEN